MREARYRQSIKIPAWWWVMSAEIAEEHAYQTRMRGYKSIRRMRAAGLLGMIAAVGA